LKQKNREATTPRNSFELSKQVQSDLLLEVGFALDAGFGAAFSLGAADLVSEGGALFSAPGFDSAPGFEASLGDALPFVPLSALEVSVDGGLFFA
jgi:hypothetical protein